jgi:hypothetical protein
MQWIVFDIGCIECCENSELLGIFNDENEANTICDFLNKKCSWGVNGTGQHRFEKFLIPEKNKIPDKYKNILSETEYAKEFLFT